MALVTELSDSIVRVLKVLALISITTTFVIAINTLVNLITQIVFDNVVGEVLFVLSCCLPFNAHAVFGAIGLAISGIFSFLVARKIFDVLNVQITGF